MATTNLQTYAEGTSGTPRRLRQIIPFVLTLLLVFGCLHYFVFFTLTRSFWGQPEIYNPIRYGFMVGLAILPIGFFSTQTNSQVIKFFSWVGYIWMGFFSFMFFLSLVELVVLALFYHDYSYWYFPVALVLSIWGLYRGLAFPKTVVHTLKNEKLRGFSMVQLSDLHVGMLHMNGVWLNRVVDMVVALKPNAVAITGDLIEARFKLVSHELESLKKFSEIPFRFYITGNHEYIHGGAIWENKLKQLGFDVLHNTNQIIEFEKSKILIAGVPDRMIKRFTRKAGKSRPDIALGSDVQVDYRILLAHQPASVNEMYGATCDLILSGHTHGGQIFPFHFFVHLVQPVVAGFKTVNGILVFAHQGTGLWGPPMRWFSQNEIVIFKWE